MVRHLMAIPEANEVVEQMKAKHINFEPESPFEFVLSRLHYFTRRLFDKNLDSLDQILLSK